MDVFLSHFIAPPIIIIIVLEVREVRKTKILQNGSHKSSSHISGVINRLGATTGPRRER